MTILTITLLVSLFVPVWTAASTKSNTSTQTKGVVTLASSLVVAAVAASIADGDVFSQATFVAGIIGFAVATAAYLAFWKASRVNDRVAPDFGI